MMPLFFSDETGDVSSKATTSNTPWKVVMNLDIGRIREFYVLNEENNLA